MDSLHNLIRLHAGHAAHSQGQPFFGIVTSYNPATHSAKVQPQPAGDSPASTGWLPILETALGNGWGVVCPPSIGEQVLVLPDSGDSNHGVIAGSVYSKASVPPSPGGSPTQSGELSLVHASGSYIRMHNDGSIDVVSHTDLRLHSTGNTSITAPLTTILGDLAVTGNVIAHSTGASVGLTTHRHGTGTAAAGTSAPSGGT